MWRNLVFLLITVRLTSPNKNEETAPPNLGRPGEPSADEREIMANRTAPAKMGTGAAAAAGRFTMPTLKMFVKLTTPPKVSFAENCDYLAYYCLKAYDTGKVCGRTLYYVYNTFKNYCMLDYVNCMERYELWQVAHMGQCFNIKLMTEYMVYPYDDDLFLDEYYIMEDL